MFRVAAPTYICPLRLASGPIGGRLATMIQAATGTTPPHHGLGVALCTFQMLWEPWMATTVQREWHILPQPSEPGDTPCLQCPMIPVHLQRTRGQSQHRTPTGLHPRLEPGVFLFLRARACLNALLPASYGTVMSTTIVFLVSWSLTTISGLRLSGRQLAPQTHPFPPS